MGQPPSATISPILSFGTRGQVRNGVSYRQLAWSPGLRPCSYWAERKAMASSSNCEFDCASVRMSVRRMSSDSLTLLSARRFNTLCRSDLPPHPATAYSRRRPNPSQAKDLSIGLKFMMSAASASVELTKCPLSLSNIPTHRPRVFPSGRTAPPAHIQSGCCC